VAGGEALLVYLSSRFRDEKPAARKRTSLKIIRLVGGWWGPARDCAPIFLVLSSALLA